MYSFHHDIADWFSANFTEATEIQQQAWQHISDNKHVLISAPTGSGKTLAAFMQAINQLWIESRQHKLENKTRVLYISPLKALSNDIAKNLQKPLEDLARMAPSEDGHMPVTAQVRTGDTSNYERQKMLKTPPHILVTTPESLYILLTSASGRDLLSTIETVIVDEIHALINTKRGAHLALSLERLQNLCPQPLKRIGISATQNPLSEVAAFLLGNRPDLQSHLAIVDAGHKRKWDLQIAAGQSALSAIMSHEAFSEIYDQITDYCEHHRTTLIFVNTRRQCERVAKALGNRLGEENVAAHHGSLAKEHRLDAENRLKNGQLKALVATAALELGIDIGEIDLVCQLGSPRSINAFLQRVGRAGHQINGVPKGRLFPLSRDDLVECSALLKAINNGILDRCQTYPAPLDVLAQQIVAEIAANEEQSFDEIWQWATRAYPYKDITKEIFTDVIDMLADGFSTRRGRRAAYIHYDRVNQRIRPRRGARLTAITNGGTIPDHFDYDVILQPQGFKIGTLNEDFSFESLPGDIFQLGNHCYQIERVETGKVYVHEADGMPPNIPFWFGEAPGRSDELSQAVSDLRAGFNQAMATDAVHAKQYLQTEYDLPIFISEQLFDYLSAAWHALGCLPDKNNIIIERFFDDADDQHIVIHSTYGSAINKAWGLALRKRFCRQFNFELQAAALEDTIILSLSSTHSFELDDVAQYLNSQSVEHVLTQALLDAPMFPTHWRWNATIALAVRRFAGGRKNPPQFQRSDAEDLVAVVFPDQIACLENIAGERDIPNHPLITQTLYDCLHDLMDIDGLIDVINGIANGAINWRGCDVNAPSPLAEEILGARPYAFLDDGDAEARRTALVQKQSFMQPEDYAQLNSINQDIIDNIATQVWPEARSIDECHDALCLLGMVSQQEVDVHQWQDYIKPLIKEQRCTKLGNDFYITAEYLHLAQAIYPQIDLQPPITALNNSHPLDTLQALTQLLHLQFLCQGPLSVTQLSTKFALDEKLITQACQQLQQQGVIFTCQINSQTLWCERSILARIRRASIAQKRKKNPLLTPAKFMQFVCRWQGLVHDDDYMNDSPDALLPIFNQLDGYCAQAQSFESAILPARMPSYMSYYSDLISQSGGFIWYSVNRQNGEPAKKMTKLSNIRLCQREYLPFWRMRPLPLERTDDDSNDNALSSRAQRLYELLDSKGAQFFSELHHQLGGLKQESENAIGELAANGMISSDNFAGLRLLIENEQQRQRKKRPLQQNAPSFERAGRFFLLPAISYSDNTDWQQVEYIARTLLKRYGILCKALLINETDLPKWRDLHYVLRRMEARDEVLGGRFIDGMPGEHFALPECITLLRQHTKQQHEDIVCISACDPLNLTGTMLLSEQRIPANSHNQLLIYGGELIAVSINQKITWLQKLDNFEPALQRQLQNAFLKAAQRKQQRPVRHKKWA